MYGLVRSLSRRALVGALLMSAGLAPAAAQDHRVALGLTGGWSMLQDLAPGLATPAHFEPGWLAGAQLEAWPASRVGLRLDGAYTTRTLSDGSADVYRLGEGSLDLLVRVLPARPGRILSPYLALGAGALRVDAPDGAPAFAGGAYGDDPATRFVGAAGLGLDVGSSRSMGLRLEVSDRVVFQSVGEGPPAAGLVVSHMIRIQTALQLRGGRISPAPVTVAAAPAPAYSPAPAAPVAAAEPEASADEMAWVRDELERLDALRSQELTRLESRVEELESRVQEGERAIAQVASAQHGAPAAAPVAERSALSPSSRLYTVQVGAFVEVETARLWVGRLERRGLPVRLTDAVVKGQAVKRVRVGMVPSVAEAQELARALTRLYGWPTWVDRVADDATGAPQAIASTRSFLKGS